MFRSIIIFLTLAVLAIATKNDKYCYEDGCKRTLQNNKWGKEECNKDLSCKLTPAAVVITKTGTKYYGVATVTFTKSTSTPVPVPAVSTCNKGFPPYLAQSCEYKAASYTSACSCISATGSTVTARAPTITASVFTVIPTSTATVYK